MRPLKEAFINKKNINNIKVGQDEIDWSKKIYGIETSSQAVYDYMHKNLICKDFNVDEWDEETDITIINDSSFDKLKKYTRTLDFHASKVYDFSKTGLKTKEQYYKFFNTLTLNKLEKYYDCLI